MKLFPFKRTEYRFFQSIALFLILFGGSCSQETSPRIACFERNQCSTIEGNCFLKNDLIYKALVGEQSYSTQDFAALVNTCFGLERRCRQNCEKTTLF